MDWQKGYSASFYVKEVDPVTWRDKNTINITGGVVKRTLTGLRNSASIDCLADLGGIEKWVRIYMDVRQNGEYGHEAIFTGIAASPKRKAFASRNERSPDCYSVLKPADDVMLTRGWFALAGTNGGDVIKNLLSVTPAPVVVADNAPVLETTIIAEDSETHLSMVDKILSAINWRIDIQGDGIINVKPYSAVPVERFDPSNNDVIEVPISITEDWYSAPNVYMAVSDDMTGIARDDNPDSPLSVKNRGREVWMTESGVSLSVNETIAEYAARQLKSAQRVRKKADYDRRFMPHVRVGDVVNLHYPAQDLDGRFLVSNQSIKLGYHAKTSETVEEI